MLRSCLRQSDIIARVGGDEFILCLYDVSESTHLQQLLAQLIQLISSLTNVAGCPISISASVGAIMTYTPENIEICEMISMADKLMYEIKKENKGTLIVKEIAA